MVKKPKRDLDERHALPADDPEAALKALIAVDPEAVPELSDQDVEKIVRGAITDPDEEDSSPPGR
jgi:hypothetical protein